MVLIMAHMCVPSVHSLILSHERPHQIGFLILTLIGVLVPLLMVNPNRMIRSDGTKVTTPRQPSWKTEFMGLFITLKTDPMIVLLFPMFFTSNWFYTWRQFLDLPQFDTHELIPSTEFSGFNGALFSIRARSLNNVCYWISQILGSVLIGLLLDRKSLSRRARAFSGWTAPVPDGVRSPHMGVLLPEAIYPGDCAARIE